HPCSTLFPYTTLFRSLVFQRDRTCIRILRRHSRATSWIQVHIPAVRRTTHYSGTDTRLRMWSRESGASIRDASRALGFGGRRVGKHVGNCSSETFASFHSL